MTSRPRDETAGGVGVDSAGNPVVDPTRNVLDLVGAAIERQDDLRLAESSAIREAIGALEKHIMTRFGSIDREFTLIESRRVEQKVDTKVAVDAALSAAEKAVKEQTLASEKSILKSERAAEEQSKQQNATFTAALKGVTDILSDVKDRVVKVESRIAGGREHEADRHQAITTTTAVLMVVAAFLSILVIAAIATHGFTR